METRSGLVLFTGGPLFPLVSSMSWAHVVDHVVDHEGCGVCPRCEEPLSYPEGMRNSRLHTQFLPPSEEVDRVGHKSRQKGPHSKQQDETCRENAKIEHCLRITM